VDQDYQRRFGGLARLYGDAPAHAIQQAHVAVVGIGGVGSWAVEALARSGVGTLTIIDLDHISESNINRQVHALTSSIGMSKVHAMAERISLINQSCKVGMIDDFVVADNWPSILPQGVDAVIDCCDNVKAKTAMATWALRSKCPFVTVGAAGGKRLAHRVEVANLNEVSYDPLLAKVRSELRKNQIAPSGGEKIGISCVFSREPVTAPVVTCAAVNDGSLNCHGYGSSVTVTATFGMCAAGWVMDKISQRSSS
jgi:tRNA A37 threonylcarbamoyladenosine dehydratase